VPGIIAVVIKASILGFSSNQQLPEEYDRNVAKEEENEAAVADTNVINPKNQQKHTLDTAPDAWKTCVPEGDSCALPPAPC
jgi:hypothetical protein